MSPSNTAKCTCDPYPSTSVQLPQSCWSKLPPPPVSWARSAGYPGAWQTQCPGSLCNGQRPVQPSSDPVSGGLPQPADAWQVHNRERGQLATITSRAAWHDLRINPYTHANMINLALNWNRAIKLYVVTHQSMTKNVTFNCKSICKRSLPNNCL